MFRTVRLRLVLLNSLVFLVILIGFGMTLYAFTQHRLYSEVDESLHETVNHIQHHDLDMILTDPDHDHDKDDDVGSDDDQEHMIFLLYNQQGKQIEQVPAGDRHLGDALQNEPANLKGTQTHPQTIALRNHWYRVVTVPLNKIDFKEKGQAIRTIDIFYSLDDEHGMLDSLKYVIELSTAICTVIVFLAGLFLAFRALIPIQKSWHQQQQFVADASHELRTPLSVIQIHLERLFHYPEHTIEQESENISTVLRETGRMRKLVADLLTLARMDSNEIQMVTAPFALDKVIYDVFTQFSYVAEVKNVRLTLKADDAVQMVGDEDRIRQLLSIVLDNALKYTDSGGWVELSWRLDGHYVHIAISDSGVGISEGDLSHIFERFFRADKARSRQLEGTGLGLSIAAWIVQEHRGKIRAESQLGTGTTFHVTLPIVVHFNG